LFDHRLRPSVERSLKPMGAALRRSGVRADHLTVLGLVVSAMAALAVADGHLILGMLLLGASAIPDVLDGAVAKASGTATPRGAFFDSVTDRASDGLVLGGVGWYLASSVGSHAAVLALAVLGTSNLVSYERAKAESLGYSANGGLMERAERMLLLALGLTVRSLLLPALWLMLVLTVITAGHRFLMVWRQAGRPAEPESSVETPRVHSAAGSLARLRDWRPSVGFTPRSERERGRWRARTATRTRARMSSGTWRRTRTRP